MKFREKSTSKFYAFALAAVFALVLAGCGGGGGTADTTDPGTMPDPDPQMECEDAGGRYNADGTCTSAAELMAERQMAQRGAISTAIGTATTAVNAVDNDSTDAEVSAADTALANARNAIANADDVPQAEKDANTGTVDALATVLAGAKQARMDAMDAADRAAYMAMMETARKLRAGISAPTATDTGAAGNRFATITAGNVVVSIDDADDVTLTENKDATVAANHGWAGKMYADPAGGDSYEAVVYSNIGEPTQGKKFGGAAANDEFEYALTNGMITVDTSGAGVPARVALPSVTRTAGTETFKLPDPNPTNQQFITVSGSFHGVSGTYSCDTGAGRDQACSASVAAKGFTLTGTWTFRPGNPNARVTDSPDANYVSYGWWIKKTADGKTFTASTFTAVTGTVDAASGLDTLMGTATYMGGAAGKYALHSSTGGTNDAGHFTARATLEADFTDNMISGTIDNFMGADGMSRDWSVELNETDISATGVIDGQDDDNAEVGTVWTIGGTDGAKSGQWRGALQDNGDDNVPKVGTGTFYTEFGADGKMVGAFGVNKQ